MANSLKIFGVTTGVFAGFGAILGATSLLTRDAKELSNKERLGVVLGTTGIFTVVGTLFGALFAAGAEASEMQERAIAQAKEALGPAGESFGRLLIERLENEFGQSSPYAMYCNWDAVWELVANTAEDTGVEIIRKVPQAIATVA